MSTIIFYAPVGNLVKGFKDGGAEAGCRKTIAVLTKAGHNVILVEKPAKKSDSFAARLVLMSKMCLVLIRLMFLFVRHRKGILHVAGFYLKQVYFEQLLIKIAQVFKIRSVYEIRNGGMIESFLEGTSKYQSTLRSLLLNATLVLCQGYDYVVFLKENFHKDSVYYPNYIMDDFIGVNNTDDRLNDPMIKLIYFGRVVPDKNVSFIIDVCKELNTKQVNTQLDIIGAYEDNYFDTLQQSIKAAGLSNSIIFHGRKNFSEIHKYLLKAHFFIFPSKEKREGQSNSLTEAMGCGVVPIVSKAGFNQSIVGNDLFVMEDFEANMYANRIVEIWENQKWGKYSNQVHARVVENFTESIVSKSLLNAYEGLNNFNKI